MAAANLSNLTAEQRKDLEERVNRFEAAWLHNENPSIENFLPDDSSLRVLVLAELVHVDLELRAKAGKPVSTETYFNRFPELKTDASIVESLKNAMASPPQLVRSPLPNSTETISKDPAEGVPTVIYPESNSQTDVSEGIVAPASSQSGRIGSPGRSASKSPDRDDHSFAKQFGRYRLGQELGKGAMGVVYLAEDSQLGRKVALKIPKQSILEEPEVLERFYREARTAGKLRHPNICPIYDVGCIDGKHYLTMAYIPGKPVSSFLGHGKLPAARQVALLIRKIAQALDHAHQQGVIHRDLKPSNVMLDDRNEPIVMDFGLARQMNTAENARLTQSGAILGTPSYMAPEQVRGEIDQVGPASDVYALGVMMYQLLTGTLPFTGPIMMVFQQITSTQPQAPSKIRPDVDPTLEAVCLRMMAKERAERYASMKEVAAVLTEYLKPTFPIWVVPGTAPSSDWCPS